MSQTPEISLVILNWNNKDLLRKCLQTIEQHKPSVEMEIIMVDNASEDGSQNMVEQEFPHVQLMKNEDNIGYAAGNNVGINAATGKYTFLLNEDIELTNNIIQTLYTYLEEHPEVGGVSPRLQYGDGSTQYSCRAFPTIGRLYKKLAVDLHIAPATEFWGEYKMSFWKHDDTREVDQPMTTAFMLSTALLQKLKGFDEDFSHYFNDVDLAYRIKVKEKKKILFIGDKGHIIHHHGQGMKKLKWGRVKVWNMGLRRFYKKHYVSSSFSPAYILLQIGLMIRTAVLGVQYLVKKGKTKY